jgi:hypothetical protein
MINPTPTNPYALFIFALLFVSKDTIYLFTGALRFIRAPRSPFIDKRTVFAPSLGLLSDIVGHDDLFIKPKVKHLLPKNPYEVLY